MTAAPDFVTLVAPAHWRTIDLVSDLHLKPEEPATAEAFAQYLALTRADAVLILGDLFEVWVGDDGATPGSFEAQCGQSMAACTAELAFMRGNRDFLMGSDFLARHGLRDLADPTVLAFAGRRILLTHGDLLCTADQAYQAYRKQVRAPAWQHEFLARPLAERRAIAAQMRAQSQAHHGAAGFYAPVDDALALEWLRAAGADTLIHGHTHDPADHVLAGDGGSHERARVVLSDWHVAGATRRAEVLRLTPHAMTRIDPSAAAS